MRRETEADDEPSSEHTTTWSLDSPMRRDADANGEPSEDTAARRRQACARCRRPARVCLCDSLPTTPLRFSTPVVVVQHPHEAKRKLQTASLLECCVEPASFSVVQGRSMNCLLQSKFWEQAVTRDGRTPLLLFPRDGAMRLDEVQESLVAGSRFCVVVIDGTWKEAAAMLRKTSTGGLASMAALDIGQASGSARQGLFAARMPPREGFVSTLEAVAYTVGALEPDPAAGASISAALLRPMLRMAQQQLELTAQHGHQVHRPEKANYRPQLFSDVQHAAEAAFGRDAAEPEDLAALDRASTAATNSTGCVTFMRDERADELRAALLPLSLQGSV